MAHALEQVHINDVNVQFTCTRCGEVIFFNKPGIGEPSPVEVSPGVWVPPDNPDQWMNPCTD
jgi:hypothetical protein